MEAANLLFAGLLIAVAFALGSAIGAVLLRASSHWLLRQNVPFGTAFGLAAMLGVVNILINIVSNALLVFAGQPGQSAALQITVAIGALTLSLAAAAAIIAFRLKVSFTRGLFVTGLMNVLGIAVIAVAAVPVMILSRM